MHSLPLPARPVVLALAPPAPGLSSGASVPSLERLGGSRLIDRLLGTLQDVGLPAPLVITEEHALPALRAALGREATVLGASGGREAALRIALENCEETLLLVHDAERALTPQGVVREVLASLHEDDDAVVPVVAMTDSVKEVRPDGLRNIDRSTLAGLQSPRLLRRQLLTSVLSGAAAPSTSAPSSPAPPAAPRPDRFAEAGTGGFDEIRAALEYGAQVRTVHGSHAGFAVVDRLSLWRAQISLGLARDTSHHLGLARRG